MRGLYLDLNDNLTSDIISRISSNSPGGFLFPKLEWLHWGVCDADTALPFFYLLLSPHLKRVTLYTYSEPSVTPRDQLPALIQILQVLPTSFEHLSILCGREEEEPLSSFVRRCGTSLRSFETCMPLSEAAIYHLMQLPNLSYWVTVQGPPRVVPTSIFPSLEGICLDEPEALPWLQFLASHEEDAIRNGSALAGTSHTKVREKIKFLKFFVCTVDLVSLSPIVKFRNLVALRIAIFHCPVKCIFLLTDEDMENIVVALPCLKSLRLGKPCRYSTCNATIASLMSISAHCPDLARLETHFNTETIVSDVQRLLDGGAGRDKPKCKLRRLVVGELPLYVDHEDLGAVAMGLKVIFPCLTDFKSSGEGFWDQLKYELGERRDYNQR